MISFRPHQLLFGKPSRLLISGSISSLDWWIRSAFCAVVRWSDWWRPPSRLLICGGLSSLDWWIFVYMEASCLQIGGFLSQLNWLFSILTCSAGCLLPSSAGWIFSLLVNFSCILMVGLLCFCSLASGFLPPGCLSS